MKAEAKEKSDEEEKQKLMQPLRMLPIARHWRPHARSYDATCRVQHASPSCEYHSNLSAHDLFAVSCVVNVLKSRSASLQVVWDMTLSSFPKGNAVFPAFLSTRPGPDMDAGRDQ